MFLFNFFKLYTECCTKLQIDNINVQGFIIIRDDEHILSRIKEIAAQFLWDIESNLLENKEKKMETVLFCRKKFWAIV